MISHSDINAAEKSLHELRISLEESLAQIKGHFQLLKQPITDDLYATLLGEFGTQSCSTKIEQINTALGTPYKLPACLIGEVRFLSEPAEIVARACHVTVDFCVDLIRSKKLPIELKTAVFHDLNLLGYMFDRQPENYVICQAPLKRLIGELYRFKSSMKVADQILWNASTAAGETDGQCLAFYVFICEATKEPITGRSFLYL